MTIQQVGTQFYVTRSDGSLAGVATDLAGATSLDKQVSSMRAPTSGTSSSNNSTSSSPSNPASSSPLDSLMARLGQITGKLSSSPSGQPEQMMNVYAGAASDAAEVGVEALEEAAAQPTDENITKAASTSAAANEIGHEMDDAYKASVAQLADNRKKTGEEAKNFKAA